MTDDARAGQGAAVMAKLVLGVLLTLALMAPSIAQTAPTPAQLCESAVELASAKYAQCRLTAESNYSKSGDEERRVALLGKCSQRLSVAFAKAAVRYGASNCTSATAGEYDAYLAQCSNEAATAAGSGGKLPVCGNGAIDVVGEQCDGNDLGGATCSSIGLPSGQLGCTGFCTFDTSLCSGACVQPHELPATGQTSCWNAAGDVIPCSGTGQDGELRHGATLAYVDNGDGTITDSNTGLMWEKLSDDSSIHDKDDNYSWDNAYSVKIAAINAGAGFAGYTDWRLPNRRELDSILNLQNSAPSVSAAFNTGCAPGCTVLTCSCVDPWYYWSSSSITEGGGSAWVLHFGYSVVSGGSKQIQAFHVRAVRGPT